MSNVRVRWLRTPEAISAALRRNVAAAMMKGAEGIKTRTVESVLDGAVLGEGHIASQPGEPPNADTGELHQSYQTSARWVGPHVFESRAGSPLEKARHLEEGTSRMAPRPHLGPAEEAERPQILADLRRAMERAAR